MALISLTSKDGLTDFYGSIDLRSEDVSFVGVENIGGANHQVRVAFKSGYVLVFQTAQGKAPKAAKIIVDAL